MCLEIHQCLSNKNKHRCVLFNSFVFIWENLENIGIQNKWASLIAQLVKNPPVIWETWVQSLGEEDPLEKEMKTHSSILACRIPWMEEPGRLQSTGSQRVGHN